MSEINTSLANNADRYIRIGTSYYKTVKKSLSSGDLMMMLLPWSSECIKQDHRKSFCPASQSIMASALCPAIWTTSVLSAAVITRSGGYELRNDWFKGSSSLKDITFIANGSNAVCLVEGFMDFLSLLELRDQLHLNANFLILNSVSLLNKSLEILKAHRDVFLFLDHDKAGKETAEKLLSAGINGIDSSGFYRGFKDVNEYLINQQPQVEKRSFGRR